MADSGCVLASLLIDKNAKKIDHYNYNIVGVLNQADPKNQAIVDEINTTLNTTMLDLLNTLKPNTNLSRDQQDYFKKQIVKQYEKKFGKDFSLKCTCACPGRKCLRLFALGLPRHKLHWDRFRFFPFENP